MSTDPYGQEPFAPPAPPSSGGGSKFLLFFGVGCGLMVLVCCGGGGLTTYFMAKSAVQITQDADAVKQQSDKIATFEVPEGFKPSMAMSINVPFVGQRFMSMAAFNSSDGDGRIYVVEMGQMAAQMDRQQFRVQMETQMQEQGQQGQEAKHLIVKDSRDLQVEIRGKPADFKIQHAEDPQSHQEYIEVEGMFEGNEGPAFFMGQLKADKFSEDDVEKIVRSIK